MTTQQTALVGIAAICITIYQTSITCLGKWIDSQPKYKIVSAGSFPFRINTRTGETVFMYQGQYRELFPAGRGETLEDKALTAAMLNMLQTNSTPSATPSASPYKIGQKFKNPKTGEVLVWNGKEFVKEK